jgi:hypothetical protein
MCYGYSEYPAWRFSNFVDPPSTCSTVRSSHNSGICIRSFYQHEVERMHSLRLCWGSGVATTSASSLPRCTTHQLDIIKTRIENTIAVQSDRHSDGNCRLSENCRTNDARRINIASTQYALSGVSVHVARIPAATKSLANQLDGDKTS